MLHYPKSAQEIADKKEMHCATLMLDQSGAEIQSRVSNQLYEWCRNDKIQLGNFPNFGPLIAALREGANPSSTKSYRVCTQQGTRLLILESLASKWTETECTKDRATSEITAHNELYNKDGDFWFADVARTSGGSDFWILFWGVLILRNHTEWVQLESFAL